MNRQATMCLNDKNHCFIDCTVPLGLLVKGFNRKTKKVRYDESDTNDLHLIAHLVELMC